MKKRKDLEGFNGDLDWELSTELYRRNNGTEEDDEQEGEEAGEHITREQTDMLGIILTGGLATTERLAAAELKDIWGRCRGRRCPFCDMEVVEDAEHVYWECPAWGDQRKTYLAHLTRLSGPVRPNLTRPLEHYSRWPKWVRSIGMV